MTIPHAYIGCDVSKAHLDFFDPGTGKWDRIDNTPDAIKALVRRRRWKNAIVVLEATGSYDRAVRHVLADRGIGTTRLNPMMARRFAEATGRHAKTDRLDARMLADLGARLTPRPDPPPCARREKLAMLHKRRDQLVLARAQERTRASECADDDLLASHHALIDFLSKRIEEIERRIGEAVTQDRRLAETDAILRSVPGIGPVTATTLLCQLPELGHLSPKQIAALAGLAPFNADSGTRRGQRAIRGGRQRVRQALYIAALSAIRSGTKFKAFYQRLRQAGKPFKVAMIATARKLLSILNAMVRDTKTYTQ